MYESRGEGQPVAVPMAIAMEASVQSRQFALLRQTVAAALVVVERGVTNDP